MWWWGRAMLKTAERAAAVDAIRRLLDARAEIVFALLHGSFITEGPYRDIDIAVGVDASAIPADRRHRYALDLAQSLELAIRHPMEVLVLNDAPLAARYHSSADRGSRFASRTFASQSRRFFPRRTWSSKNLFSSLCRSNIGQRRGAASLSPSAGGQQRRAPSEGHLRRTPPG